MSTLGQEVNDRQRSSRCGDNAVQLDIAARDRDSRGDGKSSLFTYGANPFQDSPSIQKLTALTERTGKI